MGGSPTRDTLRAGGSRTALDPGLCWSTLAGLGAVLFALRRADKSSCFDTWEAVGVCVRMGEVLRWEEQLRELLRESYIRQDE